MSASALIPVILSGGSGTRLWPLSLPAQPKQFHALTSIRTLFQQTIERTRAIDGATPPLVVCNELHAPLVAAQLSALNHAAGTIVLEPAARGTAPAVAAAALLALEQHGDDALLLVMPSDHVVDDAKAFHAAVLIATEAAREGYLVTFGIEPDRPETGYGYIRIGAERGLWALLDHFAEKPEPATAQAYLESGRYLWNSGMFVLEAKAYLSELERHAAETARAVNRALEDAATEGHVLRLGAAFAECPIDSIDYAVMEKTDRAAVVRLAAGWSDVGSWASLRDVLPQDARGNVVRGDAIVENCDDCLVIATGRRVVVAGLKDTIVVEVGDNVLVMAASEQQALKQLLERIDV